MIDTHSQLALYLFPNNPLCLGGCQIEFDKTYYVITQFTGDGNYAYVEEDVSSFLDEATLNDKDIDRYDLFCRSISPITSKDLIKYIKENLNIELYSGGCIIKYIEPEEPEEPETAGAKLQIKQENKC